MNSRWKQFRYRLEYLALSGLAAVIALLPRAGVVALAQLAGLLAFTFDRAGRRVALANLDVAFGETHSLAAKRLIARQSYQHFARTMIDLMWSPRLSGENYTRYLELEPFPQKPGEGIIIALFHYSNFEWLGHACGYAGHTGTVIAEEFKNPLLAPLFRRWREQSGHTVTTQHAGVFRLFKTLRRGGIAAMFFDLSVPAGTSAVAVRCFGLWKSVTPAPARLAQRLGVSIVPAYCRPLAGGRYHIVFLDPIVADATMTPRQITQACWDSFEPVVRAHPAPWLWMYKHWRQRPEEEGERYPFYASELTRFERMLRRP